MSRFLDVARTAALAGGYIVRERAGRAGESRQKSGPTDLVTEVDIAGGVAVARSINSAIPGSRFLIEETEVYDLAEVERGDVATGEVWVVDPIDGTTSFVHSYPCYSVSVALLRDGEPVVGAVYNAAASEMTTAEKGEGATLDGSPLRCTGAATIEESLLITGFPYDRGALLDRQLRVLDPVLRRVHGLRRDGSAAVDCCHVAAGRADGYWEFGLKAWDTAAGVVALREAGACVTDMHGEPWTHETADIVAAGPRVHEQLLELIRSVEDSAR